MDLAKLLIVGGLGYVAGLLLGVALYRGEIAFPLLSALDRPTSRRPGKVSRALNTALANLVTAMVVLGLVISVGWLIWYVLAGEPSPGRMYVGGV